jgi:hypothetical protein
MKVTNGKWHTWYKVFHFPSGSQHGEWVELFPEDITDTENFSFDNIESANDFKKEYMENSKGFANNGDGYEEDQICVVEEKRRVLSIEEDELPCEREKDIDEWMCINDHTGCLWNDGHNGCGHEGTSLFPLKSSKRSA